MNSLLPISLSNQIILIMGEHAASTWMLNLSAYLALQGKSVRVLDAGNRFNVYPVARLIRREYQNPSQVLTKIRLSRVFTCYQVETMLNEWRETASVLLVFDLLSTFYDENVDLTESLRLLRRVLQRLERISNQLPVVVSTRLPAAINAERMILFEILKEHAGEVRFEVGPEEKQHPKQLSLLPGFEP